MCKKKEQPTHTLKPTHSFHLPDQDLLHRDYGRQRANPSRSYWQFDPPADPDAWMRPAVKSDGSQYYEYALLHTDDCLVISEQGEELLRNGIGKHFELNAREVHKWGDFEYRFI